MAGFQGLLVEKGTGYFSKTARFFFFMQELTNSVVLGVVFSTLYRSFVLSVLLQQAWRLTRNREIKISSKAVKILIKCIVSFERFICLILVSYNLWLCSSKILRRALS